LKEIGALKMIKRSFLAVVLIFIHLGIAEARDEIRIVGSAAVLPFVQTVAETFSIQSGYPAPSLDVTGTGQGFRLFAAGVGYEHPDIIATPRAMSEAEFLDCRENGVRDITEIVIGRDGLIWVNSKAVKQYNFTAAQLHTALAEEVNVKGQVVVNPYNNWNEIHSSLPSSKIKVMGPPPASPSNDAFFELIMEKGCQGFSKVASLQKAKRPRLCQTVRKDGAFIAGSRYENSLVQWLKENPDGFGIARFALLGKNEGIIAANPINGVEPTLESISNGSYPLFRPIFLYVKTKHVDAIKGLQQFLYEFTSEHAIGPEGYLTEKGFIPLDDRGRNRARDMAFSLATISR
jgi:phosphate transport system substrate-binding protein